MSRAAGYFLDRDIHSSLADRDAIVTGGDAGSSNFDSLRSANVDSISVWALCRGINGNTVYPNVLAVRYVHVKSHGVNQIDPLNTGILDIFQI